MALGEEGAMVILPLFFWLEGQASYHVEDKPWPHHSSLLGDGSNAHPALYRIGSCPSRLKKVESMTMGITPISQKRAVRWPWLILYRIGSLPF